MDRNTHILVLGTPRSGTSIMFNMLCAGFPAFRHADGEARASSEMKDTPCISKRPGDSLRYGEIVDVASLLDAKLKPIIVIRDPRDVVVSRDVADTQYDFGPEGYCLKSRHWNRAMGYLAFYHGLCEWMRSESPRALVVRYEDLVLRTDQQQARIEAFIGEASEIAFQDFHKAKNAPMSAGLRAKPLVADMIGRWRDEKHEARIAKIFATPAMREAVGMLGYESDDSWYTQEAPKGA